jgi:hypothetical protein
MAVRKNQNTLTPAERQRFVAAVKRMKADGTYDPYVTLHDTAFGPDPADNPHFGPAFCPWHRLFLWAFELDLQAADRAASGSGNPDLGLPYWDWTFDRSPNPGNQRGELWADSFLSGSGSPVPSGNFGVGNWQRANGAALVRTLGVDIADLPRKEDVEYALRLEGFDCGPWDTTVPDGPSLAAPPAPTVAGASGGTLAPGQYRVAVTYVNGVGETRPSPETTVTLSGGQNAIAVTAPPAPPAAAERPRPWPSVGATAAAGYRIYVTVAGGAAGTGTLQGGLRSLGTNATINSVAPGAARPAINTTGSFRNLLEGWIGHGGGVDTHNRVHVWVGGTMGGGTSPDDPVFWLHHCNIDRIWALWQYAHPGQNYPATVPGRAQGLADAIHPWTIAAHPTKTHAEVLDHTALGYSYDTDPAGIRVNVSA